MVESSPGARKLNGHERVDRISCHAVRNFNGSYIINKYIKTVITFPNIVLGFSCFLVMFGLVAMWDVLRYGLRCVSGCCFGSWILLTVAAHTQQQ